VSDGPAAVQQAEQLQPDLILLDIGLPARDGLAVARQIRSVNPESRIVFVTQESAPDIVHAALSLGSLGYIHKTCAQYLLPVVEAILDRGPAVGNGLPADGVGCRAHHGHRAQFYSDDTKLLETVEHFLASALIGNDAAIVVATGSHLRRLLERLNNCGRNVDRAIARGSFVHFDAEELVSRFLSDGVSTWKASLIQTIESAAAATMRPHPRVAVFGECAPLLWSNGQTDMAIELEEFATEIVDTMSVDIMCGYPMLPVDHDAGCKIVCAHHGSMIFR
jgi:CheY-like chemotaxis protein